MMDWREPGQLGDISPGINARFQRETLPLVGGGSQTTRLIIVGQESLGLLPDDAIPFLGEPFSARDDDVAIAKCLCSTKFCSGVIDFDLKHRISRLQFPTAAEAASTASNSDLKWPSTTTTNPLVGGLSARGAFVCSGSSI